MYMETSSGSQIAAGPRVSRLGKQTSDLNDADKKASRSNPPQTQSQSQITDNHEWTLVPLYVFQVAKIDQVQTLQQEAMVKYQGDCKGFQIQNRQLEHLRQLII